jgi:hypothetical protein
MLAKAAGYPPLLPQIKRYPRFKTRGYEKLTFFLTLLRKPECIQKREDYFGFSQE